MVPYDYKRSDLPLCSWNPDSLISYFFTPKRQREAVLSQHKENFKEMDATESQRMARNQKEVLDREVRKFRRRRLVKYHELEQDLLREVHFYD